MSENTTQNALIEAIFENGQSVSVTTNHIDDIADAMALLGMRDGARELRFVASELREKAEAVRAAHSAHLNSQFQASQRSVAETLKATAQAAEKSA